MTEETQPHSVKVIEITQDNFDSQFGLIKQSIEESIFVAFDMEFSGLDRNGFSKAVNVDTVFECIYLKDSLKLATEKQK